MNRKFLDELYRKLFEIKKLRQIHSESKDLPAEGSTYDVYKEASRQLQFQEALINETIDMYIDGHST